MDALVHQRRRVDALVHQRRRVDALVHQVIVADRLRRAVIEWVSMERGCVRAVRLNPALVRRVLEALPEWFGIPAAIEKYVDDAPGMPGFVAEWDGEAVGFLAVDESDSAAHEIHIMGVLPSFHGRGLGRALVDAAVERARELGAHRVIVKMLSPSREDAAYAATRRFYERMGFVAARELADVWGPENPCLEMELVLPSRS